MSLHSTGVKTAAGSATLPIMSLYAAAANGGNIREIGIFNTTATAVELKVTRLTSAGTQGAALTEADHDPAIPHLMTGFTTHTIAPTLGAELGYRVILGAAVGSGIIWTMGGSGIIIPVGVANGIGVVPNGTGQICFVYMVWEE